MTYEQAKQMVARAEELAQAVKDGKRVEYFNSDGRWIKSDCKYESGFFESINQRLEYRIVPAKKRVPWTREEALRHVGWALVSQSGDRELITYLRTDSVPWAHGLDPTFTQLATEGWHVCLPGTPDDLKPCWTEVDK